MNMLINLQHFLSRARNPISPPGLHLRQAAEVPSKYVTCIVIGLRNEIHEYLTEPVQVWGSASLLEAPGSHGEGKVDQEVNGKEDPNGEVGGQNRLFKNPNKTFWKLKKKTESIKDWAESQLQ